MFFNLLFLIGFAACRAGDMEMIESYLDQMMARVGYSVNYALDQAFSETDGSDWEIYELKKDVIDQAQSMFRPLAQSVLVESFRPRLQKRADIDPQAGASGDIPTQDFPKASFHPAESFNMKLGQRVQRFFLAIKEGLIKMWNAVLGALDLGRIRDWFRRKQAQNSAAPADSQKVKGSDPAMSTSSVASFEQFKATFAKYVTAKSVGAVLGASALAYLIYAFFFKQDEGEEYFE